MAGDRQSQMRRIGKRRPQARGRATRARLLTAAEDLFTRQGYDGTSIGDVAELAGVGVGTFYHHFQDKRTILLELIDDWGDRFSAQRSDEFELGRFLGEHPREAIGRWLRSSYERLSRKPSLYLVALALAGRDPEVGRRYRRIEELSMGRWRELIAFGQKRNLMRASVDAAAAAFLIHNAIDVAATQILVRGVKQPAADRAVEELTDMICRYILEDAQA